MKKGEFDDAMDYRPIALLQTSYKVFAKVLATRLQRSLPGLLAIRRRVFPRASNVETIHDDDGSTFNSSTAG